MKSPFSITPRIIAHFGEDLIKNESIALLELVKNSYDACASCCSVDFHTDNGQLKSLIITDDGFGMNQKTIQDVWLVIGTDFKQKRLEPNCCGRFPLGEKGIGRLGVHKLGNIITLISKTSQNKEVKLTIDWTTLDQAKTIDDFTIDIVENEIPEFFSNGKTGTVIIIEGLKTKWDRRQIREVYRNLTSLNSPFAEASDSFKVVITSNANLFEGLPSFDEIKNSGLYHGHCILNGNQIESFRYEFKPWASLSKIEGGRVVETKDLKEADLPLKGLKYEEDDKGKRRKGEYDIDLDEAQIGRIEFDIIIYEMDAQIFGLVNTEQTSIRSYLRQNGGIRVYRDGVRVYDYGERDNDWLGIDLKRVGRVGGNVSNNIVLGSVKINRADSFGLREKTNREGFIENESYITFVDAVNYALSLIVRERNVDKARLTTLYKKHRVVEPVLSDLNDVIQIVERKIPEQETKDEILRYLYRINDQYTEVKDILIKSANAGLNLGVVIHEIEKQVAALIGYANNGDAEHIKTISLNLEKIVRGYSAMIRKSKIGITSLSSIVKTALENYTFRFSDHHITVYHNAKEADLKAFLAEAEALSVLTNLLDNAIYWICYARKSDRKISVYITDQIDGYNSIIVSDNGPGFNIPTDVAVQPFITGKPNNIGMGLGLHIANEMMRAMKGQLLFPEKNDINLPTIVKQGEVDNAIVALCFPKEKK